MKKIELVKELMITGHLSQDWIMKNILMIDKQSTRKEKIKKIFNV